MRLLLIDKDGTLIAPKSGATFVNKPQDQQPLPGAMEAIARYAADGWTAVIVSNQGGVAAGHKTLGDAIAEMRFCLNLFKGVRDFYGESILRGAYFCPDFEGRECYGVTFGLKATAMHDREWAPSEWMPEPPSALIGQFRKPDAGMLKLAMQTLAPLESILMVGDMTIANSEKGEDEKAAIAAGIPFIDAETWRGGA